MIENLKALKEKRKEKIKRIRRLENEFKEERDELENLDIKIAEIEGVPDEIEYIRNNRKRKSKNEIEDLLKEISEEELKDLEFEERIEEEITDEISKLYYKLCRQEGFFLEGKKGMMKAYYDFGKEFEKELCVLL